MPGSVGRWIATVCLLCLFIPATSLVVVAQDSTPASSPAAPTPPRFAIFPLGEFENPWFDVTVEPGQSIDLTVGIRNAGEGPVELQTYAANAVNPPNGGFDAASEDEPPTTVTQWASYPAETMLLQPEEVKEHEFSVTVPEGTASGNYFIALVAQTSGPVAIPGVEELKQIIRSSISVEITVPGDMTSGFELGTPVASPVGAEWSIEVPITNTGTARLRPAGELVLANSDGLVVSNTAVEMGSFYGGLSTTIQVLLPGQLPVGDYVLTLNLTDEETGASAAIDSLPIVLDEPEAQQAETFVVDAVSVTPNGDPVQYASVAATITNNGQAIPTANVTINVQRDGEIVESYPLAQNQALPQGTTEFSQRYIPIDGWQAGTWTFELIIAAVNGGTETVLASAPVADEIIVP
jgi:hypothetical protein